MVSLLAIFVVLIDYDHLHSLSFSSRLCYLVKGLASFAFSVRTTRTARTGSSTSFDDEYNYPRPL